jgi:hypothetical protein
MPLQLQLNRIKPLYRYRSQRTIVKIYVHFPIVLINIVKLPSYGERSPAVLPRHMRSVKRNNVNKKLYIAKRFPRNPLMYNVLGFNCLKDTLTGQFNFQ